MPYPNASRRSAARWIAAAAACAALPSAWAQAAWPARPLTFVVPYAAGGAADVFARQLAEKLGPRLGQAVVVDNRGVANGNIGSASVVRAPADGYTLLLGTLSTIAINPPLYGDKMPYDPARDLAPVSTTHSMANVLVVPAGSPHRTLRDLVAVAKGKPGELSYASAGVGNTQHIAGEQLGQAAGVQLVHLPYKGGAQALSDVLGGQVTMMFNNVPAVAPMVRAGKLRALAVASRQRSPQLPDVPTAEEAGMPGLVSTVWNGVLVRAGTPAAVIERLNREIVAVLNDPAMRQSLEQQGFDVIPSTPDQFAELIRGDMPKMREVVARSGAKAE
jgi:tripartite-type tricarboxylate transporter receptor subunit TctC